MIWIILGILAVIAVAFIYANLGMGGGILYVPLLLALTGLSEDIVVPISLSLILVSTLPAIFNHHASGLVDWKLGLIMTTGAIFGSIAGTLFNLKTGEEVFLTIFLAVVLAVIVKMLIDWAKKSQNIDSDDDSKLTGRRVALASLGTVGAGFMCGCLGIGGGVINVPILIYVLGRCTKKASGTSFLIILVSSIISIGTYAFHGDFPQREHMEYIAILAPIVFLASYAGSKWGIKKLNSRNVRLLFILVLFIAVVKAAYDLLIIL